MKIYTKKGDGGQTSLIGGTKVSKDDIRIEAYGTVDELNSSIGLLKDFCGDEVVIAFLKSIQDRLFTIGSTLACDPEGAKMILPDLSEEDVIALEKQMDAMNETLPELKNFLLPGGHPSNSFCHLNRCICRRAERRVISLQQAAEVDDLIIKYLNRLSDYFFVLGRKMSQDNNAEEVKWESRKS